MARELISISLTGFSSEPNTGDSSMTRQATILRR
jgi:hypothetical protein